MSVASALSRRWKPIVGAVLFGALEAYAINKVSADNHRWWWWVVVGVALVGVLASAIWAALVERQQDNAGNQANLANKGGAGPNVNVSAQDHSVAAYEVGTLNYGQADKTPTDERGVKE
jgi:hypothetical protein